MKITRTSMFLDETRTREMNLTPEQLAAWEAGTHIQGAAPHLSDDDASPDAP